MTISLKIYQSLDDKEPQEIQIETNGLTNVYVNNTLVNQFVEPDSKVGKEFVFRQSLVVNPSPNYKREIV